MTSRPPAFGKPGYTGLVVAMDGTAGSGKSSVSRAVASRLALRYLDTGAMYRAITFAVLRNGIAPTDSETVAARAEVSVIASGTDPACPTITLDGIDVSTEIRSDAVTAAVSAVSAVPRVRSILVDRQRAIIARGGIVVEGRDIGTVVAPAAHLKIYLTAESAARAQRRSAELSTRHNRDLVAVEESLRRRDRYDSSRATAPLRIAADAVVIDTTLMSLHEVVDKVVDLARIVDAPARSR